MIRWCVLLAAFTFAFLFTGVMLFLGAIYNWLQDTFGFGRGCSCSGCGCGCLLMIIFFFMFLRVIFGVDWFRLLPLGY